jgi:hypothetical protein
MRNLVFCLMLFWVCPYVRGQACQERFFTEVEKPLIKEYLELALKKDGF